MTTSSDAIHLGKVPDDAVLDSLADFICGDAEKYPVYRSSMYLTQFFHGVGIKAQHDGSTRKWWVYEVLRQLKPEEIERVVLKLVDFKLYKGNRDQHRLAVQSMNGILLMENFVIKFSGATPFIARGEGISFENEDFSQGAAVSADESEFLHKQFPEEVSIDDLGLDSTISTILQSRIDEVKACPKEQAPLALIFLLGSTLEGVLLAVALTNQSAFMSSPSAPKDKLGNARPLHDWKLNDLINVSYALKLVDLDVKNFSHTLREFRNYIHPYEQMAKQFNPDHHTAEISWHVFRAAFDQLRRNQAILAKTP